MKAGKLAIWPKSQFLFRKNLPPRDFSIMTLDLGIDVVNDGELPRENYFLHFVRKIKGIDADNLVAKTVRNGKLYQAKLKKLTQFQSGGGRFHPPHRPDRT